jgi:glycosyltransferase involved in cell wall biosynthesis
MRILFLDYAYERMLRPDAGGFRKLWELAWALQRQGHEVFVLYPALPARSPLREVPCRAYPVLNLAAARPVTAYLAQLALATAIGRRLRPHVVYFRSGPNVLPLVLKRLLGTRLVLEVNADALEFLDTIGASALSRRFHRATEAMNARGADLIVALTAGLKRTLAERYGVVPASIRVIPSGTDVDHFAPLAPGEARRRIDLPPGDPVVGFVGLFYRHQGVDILIEALGRLRHAIPGIQALIVGDGVMRRPWEELAARRGLADRVRFTGQVPYARVPDYVNAMDVVAAPFTANRGETSPFKVLDALACGRPVVAGDLPSMHAQKLAGVVLVPPGDSAALADALRWLLMDAERRVRLGQEGRAFVEREAGWPAIASRVAEAMEELRGCPS